MLAVRCGVAEDVLHGAADVDQKLGRQPRTNTENQILFVVGSFDTVRVLWVLFSISFIAGIRICRISWNLRRHELPLILASVLLASASSSFVHF